MSRGWGTALPWASLCMLGCCIWVYLSLHRGLEERAPGALSTGQGGDDGGSSGTELGVGEQLGHRGRALSLTKPLLLSSPTAPGTHTEHDH